MAGLDPATLPARVGAPNDSFWIEDTAATDGHDTIQIMTFNVRKMGSSDRLIWAEMRALLWPEATASALAEQLHETIGSDEAWGFLAETAAGVAAGFAEVEVRKYANGCDSRPVPFLEGIWVKPEYRRQGVGLRLIEYAEAFLAERGFRELGSDALLDNRISHASHLAWGFSETERVVYFRKIIPPPGR